MSAWDLIEQVLSCQHVPVELARREHFAVLEALAAIVRQRLDEGSAWAILEAGEQGTGAMQAAVKGLDPREVEVIKHHPAARNAKTKTGQTGEVMMLDPKSWQQVKQEIQGNKEYYDMLMGGVGTTDNLLQKITGTLELTMGKKPAHDPGKPTQPPPELSGKPTDPVPFYSGISPDPALGQAQGTGSPFSSRVKSQDVAGMAGSSKMQTRVQDPSKQKKVPGMEDPSEWELEATSHAAGDGQDASWELENYECEDGEEM